MVKEELEMTLNTTNIQSVSPSANPLLTPKESEILLWIQRGKTSWEIAKILGCSERTVKFHVGNFLRKLGATRRSHAVAIAMQQGLLTDIH